MTERSSFADRASNAIIYGLIRAALKLPYRTRLRTFGLFCAYFVAPIAGYMTRAQTQLALIWPDMPSAERRRIARACCDNLGRTIIENYSGDDFQAIAETCEITGPGLAAIDAARESGQAIVFVSGHFGNFEAPRRALTARGFEIGGIYRKMSNAAFNTHYEQTMMGVSGPVFAQGTKGVLQFTRLLKSGGMGTILFDVRASQFPDLDFLGKPAPTSPAAAEFASRFGAMMVPYFGRRLEDGVGFEIVVGDPIPKGDTQQMMQDATDQLAKMAEAYPEQYFWVHRRWNV